MNFTSYVVLSTLVVLGVVAHAPWPDVPFEGQNFVARSSVTATASTNMYSC